MAQAKGAASVLLACVLLIVITSVRSSIVDLCSVAATSTLVLGPTEFFWDLPVAHIASARADKLLGRDSGKLSYSFSRDRRKPKVGATLNPR